MNILHLEASTGWGGQEIRILREAEGMRLRGHQVILAVSYGGQLVSRAKAAGFTVYELNFKRLSWPISLIRLLYLIHSHQIQLVNTHSSLDSWLGGIAARIAGKLIVRTRHLSTVIKPGLNSRILYGRLADFVVTTCSSIVPIICAQSGKRPENCRSIATGVDPEKIQTDLKDVYAFRRHLGLNEDDFLVGTVCVMRSWKGIDDLLKAADLLRGVPQLKWVIVGGGHAERHIRLAKELSLENIVHFTGHLDDPFAPIRALDVFALLSTSNEGVSQAILQAAYLKRPLIATDVGGLSEVCIDRETGLVVPPFSPNRVADAVIQLMHDPATRLKMGEKACSLVLDRFTLKRTLDQMEEVYSFLENNP